MSFLQLVPPLHENSILLIPTPLILRSHLRISAQEKFVFWIKNKVLNKQFCSGCLSKCGTSLVDVISSTETSYTCHELQSR